MFTLAFVVGEKKVHLASASVSEVLGKLVGFSHPHPHPTVVLGVKTARPTIDFPSRVSSQSSQDLLLSQL